MIVKSYVCTAGLRKGLGYDPAGLEHPVGLEIGTFSYFENDKRGNIRAQQAKHGKAPKYI